MPEDPKAMSPEQKDVQEALQAVEAQIATEEHFIRAYTQYCVLGFIRIGIDRAKNIDTPFSVAGKQQRNALKNRVCNALRNYVVADALESESGFDNVVIGRIAYYENWMREIERSEKELLGFKVDDDNDSDAE